MLSIKSKKPILLPAASGFRIKTCSGVAKTLWNIRITLSNQEKRVERNIGDSRNTKKRGSHFTLPSSSPSVRIVSPACELYLVGNKKYHLALAFREESRVLSLRPPLCRK